MSFSARNKTSGDDIAARFVLLPGFLTGWMQLQICGGVVLDSQLDMIAFIMGIIFNCENGPAAI